MDVTPARVIKVRLSENRLTVRLTLEGLVPGRIYELRPRNIEAEDGESLVTRIAAYTLNELRD